MDWLLKRTYKSMPVFRGLSLPISQIRQKNCMVCVSFCVYFCMKRDKRGSQGGMARSPPLYLSLSLSLSPSRSYYHPVKIFVSLMSSLISLPLFFTLMFSHTCRFWLSQGIRTTPKFLKASSIFKTRIYALFVDGCFLQIFN